MGGHGWSGSASPSALSTLALLDPTSLITQSAGRWAPAGGGSPHGPDRHAEDHQAGLRHGLARGLGNRVGQADLRGAGAHAGSGVIAGDMDTGHARAPPRHRSAQQPRPMTETLQIAEPTPLIARLGPWRAGGGDLVHLLACRW
jgi:hypothetical protein